MSLLFVLLSNIQIVRGIKNGCLGGTYKVHVTSLNGVNQTKCAAKPTKYVTYIRLLSTRCNYDLCEIQAQRRAAAGRSRHKSHGVVQY